MAHSGSHSHGLNLSLPKQAEKFPPSSTNQIRINSKSLISIKQIPPMPMVQCSITVNIREFEALRRKFPNEMENHIRRHTHRNRNSSAALSLSLSMHGSLRSINYMFRTNLWKSMDVVRTRNISGTPGFRNFMCVCVYIDPVRKSRTNIRQRCDGRENWSLRFGRHDVYILNVVWPRCIP